MKQFFVNIALFGAMVFIGNFKTTASSSTMDHIGDHPTLEAVSAVVEHVMFEFLNNMPFKQACHRYSMLLKNRTLNDESAEPAHFPWMVALGYSNGDNHQLTFECGGTIISEWFVLTAAHCVKSSRQPIVVRMGTTHVPGADGIRPLIRYIKNIIPHPNYSSATAKNDIALIRLEKEIDFGNDISPACLQGRAEDKSVDVKLSATSWDITSLDLNQTSNESLNIEMKTIPLNECRLRFQSHNISDGQYCAYNVQRQNNTCRGHSGGPLFFYDDDSIVPTIIGIDSVRISCRPGVANLYTRVAIYSNWIQSIVWPR